MCWTDINDILSIDKSFLIDFEYIFMKAAASKKCNLEVLYNFMMRDIDSMVPIVREDGKEIWI